MGGRGEENTVLCWLGAGRNAQHAGTRERLTDMNRRTNKFAGYDASPLFAELYDLLPAHSQRGDVDFYVQLCRSAGGKVLELGCGTGRVTVPIALAGLEVVGLDRSETMLDRCRDKVSSQPPEVRARIQVVKGDMTDFRLEHTFNSAVIPFRAFQHLLEVDEQLACLRCVNRHLRAGGTLAFDCFQVNLQKMANRRLRETEDVPEFELPDGRRLRRRSRIVATHRSWQYNDVEIIYHLTDAAGKTRRLVQAFLMRYFFRYELEHLLARAGFEVAELYGDFDRSPLTDDSPEMVFVARKVARRK